MSSSPTTRLSSVHQQPEADQAAPDHVDNIIQLLFAASMFAEGLSTIVEQQPAMALPLLSQLHEMIRSALGEAYSLQRGVRAADSGGHSGELLRLPPAGDGDPALRVA